jgi:hypothetical protein
MRDDDFSHGIGLLLVGIALPLMIMGMFGLSGRFLLWAAAVAIVGIIIRLARL